MIFSPLPYLTYRFVQDFGSRPEVYERFGLDGHNGYDLAPLVPGSRGVVVYSPHEGYVSLHDEGKDGYGKFLTILSEPVQRNGTRHRSDLAHLASFAVGDGQYVAANEPVGIMGSTGFSTGIHLHWTYKKADGLGKTLGKDNGYKGAIPVGPHARQWLRKTLTSRT